MNKTMVIGSFVAALIYSAGLGAATLIESEDTDGAVQKMWFEGTKMRMDSDEGYALIDWDAATMYFVSMEQGMVMDMSYALAAQADGGKSSSGVKATVEKVGGGPEIAGYDTVHYQISVDGEHCRDVFVSKKAMSDMGSKDIMKRMEKFADSDMGDMGDEWSTPCDHADSDVDYIEVGFPLRTMYVDSGEVDEVRRIVLDADLPEGGFDLPKGMKVMDMGQMMQQMQQGRPQQ